MHFFSFHLANVHLPYIPEYLRPGDTVFSLQQEWKIHGHSWDSTKQHRALVVILGILELRPQESFRILNPLPGGWEVTKPITVKLSLLTSSSYSLSAY